MTTIRLLPKTKDATVAMGAVIKSLENRKYPHFVRAFGRMVGKGAVEFSYLDVTTDPKKAEAEGFTSPDLWLTLQKSINR